MHNRRQVIDTLLRSMVSNVSFGVTTLGCFLLVKEPLAGHDRLYSSNLAETHLIASWWQ